MLKFLKHPGVRPLTAAVLAAEEGIDDAAE